MILPQIRLKSFVAGVTVAASALSACTLLALQPASAAVTAEKATASDAFVNSIGVNTHITYGDRSYGNYEAWKTKLVDSGIRNIRDGVAVNQDWVYDRINELSAAGVKTNLQLGRPFNGKWSNLGGDAFSAANNPAGTLDQLMPVLKTKLAGSVTSIEGPNEYDLSGDPNWANNLRTYQQRLYTAVKSDPATAHLPVIAPSLVYAGSRSQLGQVPADRGNMHNYTGGEMETSAHLDSEIRLANIVSGGKPAWSTECNPNTALNATTNQPAVSEPVQAVYTLRQFLESWRKGVDRTYIYELMDEANNTADAESTWGILRHDASPKPAYTALKNMISLLNDKGATFSAGSLAYDLEGANDRTREVLLQKRDGSFWLAVWQEDSVWDTKSKRALNPAAQNLTLKLGSQASSVATYQPTKGTSVQRSAQNVSEFSFSSSADVTLVKIGGAGSAPVNPQPSTPVVTPTPAPTTPAPTPTQPQTPVAGEAIRINSGGGAVTEANGTKWIADKHFRGGNSSATDATVKSASPLADASERWGAAGYSIPVAAKGTYDVVVHTTELAYDGVNKRSFDISAEGAAIATAVDPGKLAGRYVTHLVKAKVNVTDGVLDVDFTDRVNRASISAIEVVPSFRDGGTTQPSAPVVTPTPAPTTPAPKPTPAPVAGEAIRINSGGGAVTEANGTKWIADKHFRGGNTSTSGAKISSATPLADASERWGAAGYSIPVAAKGTYEVVVHVTELAYDGVNKRSFDIAAEGSPIATAVDAGKVAGRYTTHLVKARVTVDDGTLDLDFTDRVNRSSVSAIEVVKGS
ncbi:malectin domain-containing carbohydrate-binding protein [Kineococcus sp. SYSU DK005]|uniref:malectin domain-containing carbohydrate-binding protein n=1 Tax=Kineococcus sp. SYSU DK005 TaxID=3383126 RepID=UPI003D7D79CA